MDTAARKLGMDPAELRRRNMIDPALMPYTNAMGQVYDSGKFAEVLDQGLALADWDGFAAREAASKAAGKLRGRGIASFLEWTGANVFEERVTVAVKGAGEIEIYATTQQMGQGIATSYAQLAVDVFGVPLESIRIVLGDTDRGTGFGSAGSRSLFTAGLGGEGRLRQDGGDGEGPGGGGAGSRRHRPRIRRRRLPRRRHRPADRAVRAGGEAAGAAHLHRQHQQRRRPDLAERHAYLRGRDRPRYRRGRDRLLCLGQRCRPGGEPADRRGPDRRRRGAGPRPGDVRGGGLRPRIRPAAERQLHGLRAAAGRHDRRLRDQARPVDPLRDQPAGREGRRRARHHRRDAGAGERGGGCAGPQRPCGRGGYAADAADPAAGLGAAAAPSPRAAAERPGVRSRLERGTAGCPSAGCSAPHPPCAAAAGKRGPAAA